LKDSYYFISDVHLGLEDKNKEKLKEKILLTFLDEVKKNAVELFIIGDLFDYWIEYREVVPKGYYKIFAKFSELIDEGIKITYLAGNHDFWRGKYFKDEFGIEISDKPIERQINGKKFFLHHGDGLAYNDTGYKILKKILRSKVNQFLYSLVHPDIGIKLAKKSSHSSRFYTSAKDYSKNDGIKDYGIEKIKEGFDYAIMGHRHRPQIISPSGFEGKFYINLGDWIFNFTYAVFRNENIELVKYYDLKNDSYENKIIKPEIIN